MPSIMHKGKPCGSSPPIDMQLDVNSNHPVANSVITAAINAINTLINSIKGWIGFTIGPGVKTTSSGNTTVTFTNALISATSELHLISDNGKGSSNNANTSSWDTPVFYNSVAVDDTNHTATYTFTAATIISNTDFYLKIKNSWQSPS